MAKTSTTTSTRVFVLDAEGNKTLLTNAYMMRVAIDALRTVDADPAVIEKAEKHLASMVKTSFKSDEPSETEVKNREDAERIYALMPDGFVIDNAWICLKMGYVKPSTGGDNTQKATQVMKFLVEDGRVTKIPGRPVQYKKA